MKKNDDDLLRLAFGELSAESARAVEAQAQGDASARWELEALRDLRRGLQNLPPPPPDTLSAERLRAAILDREIKRPRPAPFGWAWAPFALAACVGFVLFMRPQPKGEPQIVSFNDTPAVAPEPTRFDFGQNDAAPAPAAGPTSVAMKTQAAPAERRVATARRRPRNHAAPAPTPEPEEAKLALLPREPLTIVAPGSAVVASNDDTLDGGADTVVVVSSDQRDLDTGASAATETEASNVLVGG